MAFALGLALLSAPQPPRPQAVSRYAGDSATVLSAYDNITSDGSELAALQRKFRFLVRQVAPSVVAVSASTVVLDSDKALHSAELTGQKLRAMLEQTTRTVGTGFVIDADGYIVTSEHVISDAEQIWVTTDDKRVYPAVVIGTDPRADLAVLKIPASNLPVVRYAPFDSITRGQWTIALGNPYGLSTDGEMSMSVGVISALNRSLPKLAGKENRLYTNLLQTTAQINPGNSGGPLFDLEGRVIGITTAVILPQKTTSGIGFAITLTPALLQELEDLKAGREITYGYLGTLVSPPSARERRSAGLDEQGGARIDSVEDGSPAAAAGLKVGDLILSLGGSQVTGTQQFISLVGRSPVGLPLAVEIWRSGRSRTLQVQLVTRQLPAEAVSKSNQRLHWQGMVLGNVPANWDCGTGGMMVVGIEPQSPLKQKGVVAGSVITAIAGHRISGITDFQKALDEAPSGDCQIEFSTPRSVLAAAVTP